MKKTQKLHTVWQIKDQLFKEELFKEVNREYFNIQEALYQRGILDSDYFPVLKYRKLKYFKTVRRYNAQFGGFEKLTVATDAGLKWLMETQLETINEWYKREGMDREKRAREERSRLREESRKKWEEYNKKLKERREAEEI